MMSTTQDNELQELLFSDAYSFLAESGVHITTAKKMTYPESQMPSLKLSAFTRARLHWIKLFGASTQ